jgi:protein ImuA
MGGQGSDFPEFPGLAASVADTPGTDHPPVAGADRPDHDAGHSGRSDARIASLRALVGRLAPGAVGAGSRIPLGLEALDRALGGGLPRGALHAVLAGDNSSAAAAFAAFLLARRQTLTDGPLLWLPARADLYGPGLARLGLDTGRLVLIETPRPADRLWAFEEMLRTAGVAGVVAELDRIEPKAARRLQLAAETAGTTGLVLQSSSALPVAAATTRWSVAALPGGIDGYGFPAGFERPRWQLALLRSRLGRPGSWNVEAQHDPTTDRIALAAAICDRAPEAVMAGA